MRTAFLLLATLLLLAGGFAIYLFVQPKDAAHNKRAHDPGSIEPAPIQQSDSAYQVRGGKNVWLKEFDENRRLTNQFRAEEFHPQKEGFVRVKKPEAHFFMKGGQWIRVTGETGDVVVAGMPESGGGGDPFAGMSGSGAAPSRGRLQTVRIQLYDAADSTSPTLDMDMNNAAFDNESFRIFTEGYTDEQGKQIAADQVKVTVRGKYEFDGRGLTIRWNDRDRRLELLEIAHGERLVIKEPGTLGTKMPGAEDKRKQSRIEDVRPIALASADPAAAKAAATTAAKPPTTQGDSTLYSIWFYDNVQVVQADQTLATGNVIEVFYAMRNTAEKQAATTRPAPAPTSAPRPDDVKPKAPSTAPTTAPTTAPAQQPVVIYWTGKLRVVPATTSPPVPLDPGQSAIDMRGLPVVLTRDNAQIRSASFTYRTADGGVTLNNSQAFPQVEITQFTTPQRTGKPQMTLFSEHVDYAPEQGIATMFGKSRAIFPADQAGKSNETAQATWTRQGVAHFIGNGNQSVMQHLELSGDVDVQHPQLTMKSQRLNLKFEPPIAGAVAAADPATPRQPDVRQVIADDQVHCVLLDEAGQERQLHGDHLEINTAADPAGRMYPRVVNARGHVRALQEGQELTSEELALVLAPAAAKKDAQKKQQQPQSTSAAVELQRMVAKTNVRAVSKDGDVATGDTLVIANSPDGKPQVGLSGKPAKLTNVRGTVLTCDKIVIPNAQQADEAQALGPGTLHALVEDAGSSATTKPGEAKAPPKYMDAEWTDSALVNMKLKEHHVQVVGKVKATMRDADGTVNTASGERILITLSDPPATRPAERKTESAKNNGTLGTADVDVMKGRQVNRILVNKDAVVNSRLAAADGTVLREMQIDSSLLDYRMPQRRLLVPRPGRMLVRDHRPPEVKAGSQQEQDGMGSQRGATAFQWSEEMDYNGVEQRATMKGDVLVAYKPDAPADPPVTLRADQVFATFEDKPGAAGAPAAPAAPAADSKMPAVQLRSIRAEGNTNVIRGTEELSAPRLTYDPVSHVMKAIGTDQQSAIFTQNSTNNSTTAREFQWNTETWKMKVIGATGRATPPPGR